MRIVITRPAEDSENLAAKLRAQGHETLIHPLLEIAFPPLPPIALEDVVALVATSRNALKGFAANAAFDAARARPIYCVGEATADSARQLGFSDIRTGAGTAKDLPALIAAAVVPQAGTLLYLTGEQIAFDLQGALSALGFAVRRVTVYEAREASHPTVTAFASELADGKVDGVILMSPRTASIFATIWAQARNLLAVRDQASIAYPFVQRDQASIAHSFVQRDQASIAQSGVTCYCLSGAVAAPLRNFPELLICVAKRPTQANLLALIPLGAHRAQM